VRQHVGLRGECSDPARPQAAEVGPCEAGSGMLQAVLATAHRRGLHRVTAAAPGAPLVLRNEGVRMPPPIAQNKRG